MLEILNLVFKIVILNPSFARPLIFHPTIQSILKQIVFTNIPNKIQIYGVLSIRLIFLFYLFSLFIVFITSCSNYLYKHSKNDFITRFPNKPDNNTLTQLGIPFCSVLYKPEEQYNEFTSAGRFNFGLCYFYFGFEVFVLTQSKISSAIRELRLTFWIEMLKILITLILLVGGFFLGSYIFQVYVGVLTNGADQFFKFLRNLKRANKYYGDTLIIQVRY